MTTTRVNRNIICIDLKSFFASVECVERHLDPYTFPLVVCDPSRNGAITLAVTPYLKKFGVKSRGRVYELPKNIKILKVPPRMHLYQQKSKEVIDVYMEFIAPEDMHIYSIDEVFLDVTDYLKLYQTNTYNLALTIINRVKEKTGLTVTAGIGPNLLLAKISMDIEAKHVKNNIAEWTYDDIQSKLWTIHALSKMWGIGPRLEKKLNSMGLYSIGDIAKCNLDTLRHKFGVLGIELWEHVNGIDNTNIKDLNNHEVASRSFSHSQVLFKDYYDYNIQLIILEMIDILCRRLRKEHQLTGLVSFGIGYSKAVGGGFYHSHKLDALTDSLETLYKNCMHIFDRYYENKPIRKVSISFGNLVENDLLQLNLFENIEEIEAKENINKTVDEIKERFGPNMLLKASSLLSDSTIKERNMKVGGHHV